MMHPSSPALYEMWSHEFRTGIVTEKLCPQFVSRLNYRLEETLTEEIQRITRVVDIVPIDVDIVLDPRTCIRAMWRAGIIVQKSHTCQ